jgi:tetratricopeptide (TPR) repeat protein
MTILHKGLYYKVISFDEALATGLRAAQEAVELDPEHYYGYNWLSNWQWHAKQGQASMQTLKKVMELSPNNADVNYYAAFQAARQNRLEDCLKFSERSVALDPKNPEPYWWIACSNFILGDLARAEWALLKNLGGPEDVFYYGDLGYLHYLKGEYKKALEYAIKSPVEHYRLLDQSLIYHSIGDIVKADSTLNVLKGLADDVLYDLNTHFFLAVVHAHRQENDLAFEYLYKAKAYIKIQLEDFFTIPEFKNLYDDPRWDSFIDNLSQEFNYDFKHKT